MKNTQLDLISAEMVASKVNLIIGVNRPAQNSTRNKVGVKDFKVFSENDKIEVDDADARKKYESVHKDATLTTTSRSQFVKGGLKNMEKGKGRRDAGGNTNDGRKALADVSNIQGKVSRNAVREGPKPLKSKIESYKSLQRISIGPCTRTANVSLRKSFVGKERETQSRRVGPKDLKVCSNDQGTKTNGPSCDSFITNGRRFANPHILTRKSLPVLNRTSAVDAINSKHNVGSLEKSKERSGFPVKAKVGLKVLPQFSNVRSDVWRSRASDGFLTSHQNNVASSALIRKPVKPTLKSTIAASNAQKSSKSKCISKHNTTLSLAPVLSEINREVATSSSEGEASLFSHDSNQTNLQADVYSKPSTNTLDINSKRRSTRRRSYTSSLVERSKFLGEHTHVMKQDELPSIDDDCNQLEVAEYVDDIYQYYWVIEVQSPSLANYMSIQTDITPHMRGILINWLVEVHVKFELMQETLYLMVTLLDQYLSQVTTKKNELQLVGLTALLLASKYEDFWHPRIKDLLGISVESYTKGQMLGMERLFLKKLKFRLNVPTPYVFMLRFLKAAQSNTKLEHMAFYLMELCLVEYEALKFKPSLLSASAIYVARCSLQMTPAWTPLLVKHAHYEESQIRDCADMILRFQKASKTARLHVTYEKYSRPDLSSVAAIKPLDRLPL